MRTVLLLLIRSCVILAAISPAAGTARSQDWPQFLGPARNGSYTGPALADAWPKEGPPVLWKTNTGSGWSGPVIADGRLILHQRFGDREVVECLNATNGNPLWKHEYPTAYKDGFGFDDGPRGTPCIAGGKVFTFGAEGMLTCLDLARGGKLWSVDTKGGFHPPKGFFGMACSPLVEGGAVLVNVGGKEGAGIVAFDKDTGKMLWKATSSEASYSSPVAASIGGQRHAFFFNRDGLAALDPANGTVRFEFPWRPAMSASVNAATPVVVDDLIFISTCYDRGAIVLRFKESGPEKVWSNDESLSCHYATPVHYQGCLYGFEGRADPGFQPAPSLRCVELKTGKVRWSDEAPGAGTVMLTGGRLLVLTDKGELLLAPASRSEFKPLARAQILPTNLRAHPALAAGLFYARSKDKLVCLDLRTATRH